MPWSLLTCHVLALSWKEPAQNPFWMLLTAFAIAAVIVWFAGTYLSRYADAIAERTGMGQAFVGVLLLGGATSLPEIATTATAATVGNAALAGNNLLGGIAMQLAVLAAVDALAMRGHALTFFTPKPALLMQGVMLVLMTSAAAAAVSAGDRYTFAGVGAWSVGLAGLYLLALWAMRGYEGNPRWEPTQPAGESEIGEPPMHDAKEERQQRFADRSTAWIWVAFGLVSLAVLIGGFVVAMTGDALAVKTGIGSSLVGATLVALATSLPEVSTTWTAVRMGAYAMAVANILGTNSLEVALFFVADVFYRDGSIFNQLDARATFLAGLGGVVTCVFLWGLLERRDRTILGMGVDSALVLVLYFGGLVVFYFVQGG